MNPNFPNSMYQEEPLYSSPYHNYVPYIKQPLARNTSDKRSLPLPIHDLLRLNIGQVITIYKENVAIKGVLEYCSDSYLILHDPKNHLHTLLFLKDIEQMVFEDEIEYNQK